MEEERMTKTRFEDIANNDININQERRTVIKIEKMDFVNKCQVPWKHQFSLWFIQIFYGKLNYCFRIEKN